MTIAELIQLRDKTNEDYFEFILLENGSIELAVPSHIEAVLRLCGKDIKEVDKKMGETIKEHEVPIAWLVNETKLVSVWRKLFLANELTQEQKEALIALEDNNFTLFTREYTEKLYACKIRRIVEKEN